jgi:hypothetical protein
MAERRRDALRDQRVEEIIGDLLRAGVIIAASVVAFGGIVYLVRHGAAAPNYRVFLGEPVDYAGYPESSPMRAPSTGAGLFSWDYCSSWTRR